MKNRMQPLAETSRELWLLSGNECAWDDCRQRLMEVDGAWVGKVAHIVGAELGSARHQPTWTPEQLRDVSNLVLLCGNHHDRIDHPRSRDRYGEEFLRALKARHEQRFRVAVERVQQEFRDVTDENIVTYCATLGTFWLGEDDDEIRAGNVETVNKMADLLSSVTLAGRQLLAFLVTVDGDIGLAELARRNASSQQQVLLILDELERNKLAYLDRYPLEGEVPGRVAFDTNNPVLDGWIDFWDMLRTWSVALPDNSVKEVIVGLNFSLLD